MKINFHRVLLGFFENWDKLPQKKWDKGVGRMRLTICRRIGYTVFVASGGVCFLHNSVGCRITPPVAMLNIHPIANAVSEWDAND